MTPTIHQFYSFLRDAVRYHAGGSEKWERLNTFAVIPDIQLMNTDNFGKNMSAKDRPFFYSRRWASAGFPTSVLIDYPAVLVRELSSGLQGAFSSSRAERVTLEVYVAYPNIEGATDNEVKKYCPGLDATQVHYEMRKRFSEVLHFIERMAYVHIDGADPEWANIDVLNAMKLAGDISDYQIQGPETATYKRNLNANNQAINFEHFDNIGNHALTGIVGTIEYYTSNCGAFEYTPDLRGCNSEKYGCYGG